ncbi:MAG TPA: class I SAM-dependent methyltransferase [Thermoanaerobaculia bacterium]|jgi:SAM-dependent methyltransferase
MNPEPLRWARTAALRLAGPLDWLWRQARGGGRAALPPLWLRRHTGPVGDFESAAAGMVRLLEELELLPVSGTVLDCGCGAGAMAAALEGRLGEDGRYVGFDVHAPSIRWCRRRFASDGRLTFALADVASAYGSPRGAPASGYRFPIDDGGAGLVLAKSLFTHLLRDDAAHYLREIRRALRPGSPALVTAFLFDETGPAMDAVRREFPHEDPEARGRVRFRLRARPTAAVAYARAELEGLVERAGLRVQWLRPGFYPGVSPVRGQDTLLLGH